MLADWLVLAGGDCYPKEIDMALVGQLVGQYGAILHLKKHGRDSRCIDLWGGDFFSCVPCFMSAFMGAFFSVSMGISVFPCIFYLFFGMYCKELLTR